MSAATNDRLAEHQGRNPAAKTPSLMLIAGLGCATLLRVGVAGSSGVATSVPAGVIFALAVLALFGAVTRGSPRNHAPRKRSLLIGGGGGVFLVALPLLRAGAAHIGPNAPTATLALWVPVVIAIAVAEEAILRGVLFDYLGGGVLAVVATSAVFGVMHVPLYGVAAVPLDTAVGIWLGGLRLVGGGVSAPGLAHVIADVAAGWIH